MKATQTQEEVATINAQTFGDFRNSVLIVSVLANLYVLTAWLVIQVS